MSTIPLVIGQSVLAIVVIAAIITEAKFPTMPKKPPLQSHLK